jgi:hypothetical protein
MIKPGRLPLLEIDYVTDVVDFYSALISYQGTAQAGKEFYVRLHEPIIWKEERSGRIYNKIYIISIYKGTSARNIN